MKSYLWGISKYFFLLLKVEGGFFGENVPKSTALLQNLRCKKQIILNKATDLYSMVIKNNDCKITLPELKTQW